jgi:lipoprotein-releasing system ATP-binding protein
LGSPAVRAFLLADEPTGNLDPHTAERVFEELMRLVSEEGVAAVVATHNLDLAARMDRTLRLAEGHLVEEQVVVVEAHH